MKLCECGCGEILSNQKSRFIKGHYLKMMNKNQEFQKKAREGVYKKHGVYSVFSLKEIKDKILNTNQEKYGVTNYAQTNEFKNKSQKTWQKNLGVDNPSKSKIVVEKRKTTNLLNWGDTCYLRSNIGKEIIKNILIDKYGVDNPAKTEKNKQRYRENFIKLIEIQKLNNIPLSPRVGILELPCIDLLQSMIPEYKINRQKQIIGFFPDGYIKELNMVIEFDEDWHKQKFQVIKDEKKNQSYQYNNIFCFRITQHEWQTNQNYVIDRFMNIVNGIEEIQKFSNPIFNFLEINSPQYNYFSINRFSEG